MIPLTCKSKVSKGTFSFPIRKTGGRYGCAHHLPKQLESWTVSHYMPLASRLVRKPDERSRHNHGILFGQEAILFNFCKEILAESNKEICGAIVLLSLLVCSYSAYADNMNANKIMFILAVPTMTDLKAQ